MFNENYKSLSDIIAKYIVYDLSNPEILLMVQGECAFFMLKKLVDPKDLQLFKIDFIGDTIGDKINVFGNNLISSLWLIGVYPPKPKMLNDKNECIIGNIKYTYNPFTRKVTTTTKKIYVDKKHHNRNNKKNSRIPRRKK